MSSIRFGNPILFLAILITLVGLASLACGVKSGDRSPARSVQIEEFHRSPVTAFEQLRIDLTKEDDVCTADPADLNVISSQRVRLAIQLPTEIAEGITRSLEVTGERIEITYAISGLVLSGSGGAFRPGVTEFNVTMESGARNSYDFNTASIGTFDILCDGEKVGTFTVTEG